MARVGRKCEEGAVKFELKFHTGDYVRMGEGVNAAYLWDMPHKK